MRRHKVVQPYSNLRQRKMWQNRRKQQRWETRTLLRKVRESHYYSNILVNMHGRDLMMMEHNLKNKDVSNTSKTLKRINSDEIVLKNEEYSGFKKEAKYWPRWQNFQHT